MRIENATKDCGQDVATAGNDAFHYLRAETCPGSAIGKLVFPTHDPRGPCPGHHVRATGGYWSLDEFSRTPEGSPPRLDDGRLEA